MSRFRTQVLVAKAKAEHPEQFCPQPRCLWRTGDGSRCPRHGGVRFERLKSAMDGRNGNGWEAFAPEGFHFVGGAHSLIVERKTDLVEDLEPCTADCECKQERGVE